LLLCFQRLPPFVFFVLLECRCLRQSSCFLLSTPTCLCFGLAETGCGLLDALELFCLCFAQRLNSRFESLFCLCSLLRFCFGLAALGLGSGRSFFFLLSPPTCLCCGCLA